MIIFEEILLQMPPNVNPKDIFYQYFPVGAVEYCFSLWQKYNFHFKISKKRESKLGDYRYVPKEQSHTITINADLNPFSFLVTYLHEVAHLLVTINYKNGIAPHGKEWKHEFKKVALPILNDTVFPTFILSAFNLYIQNPKASSCSDQELLKALNFFDEGNEYAYLADINIGKMFQFNNRKFIKQENRRTRILCKETATGKMYLISKMAKVNINET